MPLGGGWGLWWLCLGVKCSERGQDSQGQVGVKGPDGNGAWGVLRRLIGFLLPHTSDPLGWGCL